MCIAAIYDIHGNLPALEAVLAESFKQKVGKIVVGGDVFPGPMALECLDLLRNLDVAIDFICGNGDRVVLRALSKLDIDEVPKPFQECIRWNANQIDGLTEVMVRSWPETHRLHTSKLGDILFCHATPRNDTEVFLKTTAESTLIPIFDSVNAQTVVCGHTHMQFDRMITNTRVINAGSVGMPYGEPGAYWLLIDSDFRLMRTDYDLESAAKRILETEYPMAAQFADDVMKPRSEQEMLDLFARVEISSA